jgi:hypothetical protein
MSVVFAIQFVALLGQLNAPLEKSFRSLTLSFSWANLQFGMPQWLLDIISWVTGDENIDGKLSYGFGLTPGGQEIMLLKKGMDAEDFLLGNVFSNVAVIVCVKFAHTLLQDFLMHTSEKARAKAKEMRAVAKEKGMPELAPPVPPKFVMPDSLCWRKILVLLLSATHQGVCQSTMVALSYPDCSYFINMFATITFIIFPLMYSVTSVITLRGAMDMHAKLPSVGNFGPWKGKYLYKNDMKYSELAKKIGTIPRDMGPKDLKWLKAAKNENLGTASKIALRGEWSPQTPEAKRFLATYSPMFSKYTRAGFLLVGLDLFKKILQSFFLSFIGTPAKRSELPPPTRVYLLRIRMQHICQRIYRLPSFQLMTCMCVHCMVQV